MDREAGRERRGIMVRNEWKSIYETYYKQLYLYSLSLVGNKHDAEDLLQETFVKAYAYVNGKRLAIALEKSISLNLKPGKHKILFQRAALKSKTLELIVQPSKNYCVNVIPKTFSIDVVIVEMER